jgi:hypothetical protein
MLSRKRSASSKNPPSSEVHVSHLSRKKANAGLQMLAQAVTILQQQEEIDQLKEKLGKQESLISRMENQSTQRIRELEAVVAGRELCIAEMQSQSAQMRGEIEQLQTQIVNQISYLSSAQRQNEAIVVLYRNSAIVVIKLLQDIERLKCALQVEAGKVYYLSQAQLLTASEHQKEMVALEARYKKESDQGGKEAVCRLERLKAELANAKAELANVKKHVENQLTSATQEKYEPSHAQYQGASQASAAPSRVALLEGQAARNEGAALQQEFTITSRILGFPGFFSQATTVLQRSSSPQSVFPQGPNPQLTQQLQQPLLDEAARPRG